MHAGPTEHGKQRQELLGKAARLDQLPQSDKGQSGLVTPVSAKIGKTESVGTSCRPSPAAVSASPRRAAQAGAAHQRAEDRRARGLRCAAPRSAARPPPRPPDRRAQRRVDGTGELPPRQHERIVGAAAARLAQALAQTDVIADGNPAKGGQAKGIRAAVMRSPTSSDSAAPRPLRKAGSTALARG